MAFASPIASPGSVPYIADDRPRLSAAGLAAMARASGLGAGPSTGARLTAAGVSLAERVARGEPLVSFGAQADVGPYSALTAALVAFAPVVGFLGFIYLITNRKK